jgi:16S rRNA (uracil1498-N3)-methyltransferase
VIFLFFAEDMSTPFFYIGSNYGNIEELTLDEDTSRHIVQVLRMKAGEKIKLADGKGNLLNCVITGDHKRHCNVRVESINKTQKSPKKVLVGISLLKNANRFEWFLEKATELGVDEIIPLLCDRTEKEKFRHDRLHGILVSAMLQSQQGWLPLMHEPISFDLLFRMEEVAGASQKFIAHCNDAEKRDLSRSVDPAAHSRIILIGPEGDFTAKEIETAVSCKFLPVSLGENRLRTETAGVVAATILRIL